MSTTIDTKHYHDRAEPVLWIGDKRYVRCAKCGVIITQTPNGICSQCRKTMFDWKLENFAKFWENIDYEEAMRQKAVLYYEPDDADLDYEDWDDEPEYDPDWDYEDF